METEIIADVDVLKFVNLALVQNTADASKSAETPQREVRRF